MHTEQHTTTPNKSQSNENSALTANLAQIGDDEFDTLLARSTGPEGVRISASTQQDFEAQFAKFCDYIVNNPNVIPARVLAAIGEALILDLANEASIRGRSELDALIKDSPQSFLFINSYIDRIGIAFGNRWVADKDINRVIAEIKIAQHENQSRPLLKRLWDAACNKDSSVVSSLSEECETLFAQRLALKTEVTQLNAKKGSLEAEILRITQEQQVKLLQEHRVMVSEQIERQEEVAKDLRAMQEEISRLQQQRHEETERHLDQIRRIKEEIRSLQSARDVARSEYKQARGESTVVVPSDSEKERFVAGVKIELNLLCLGDRDLVSPEWSEASSCSKNFLRVVARLVELEAKAPEALPEVLSGFLKSMQPSNRFFWGPLFSRVLIGEHSLENWLEDKRAVLEMMRDIRYYNDMKYHWPGYDQMLGYNEFSKLYRQAISILRDSIGSNQNITIPRSGAIDEPLPQIESDDRKASSSGTGGSIFV